jgi:UDP-N-acetylglucosamine acyltransferase
MQNAAAMIHPSAVVHETAVLGDGVEIGAYSIVGAGCRIGAGCRLLPHAVVCDGVELGEGCLVDSFCVIGGEAQMRTPDPLAKGGKVTVGPRTVFREGVTVHRPSRPGGVTTIGADCFFMASTHVAHDCEVSDWVTMANGAMLGGHVLVGPHAFVGGGAGVHQFVRLGESSMVAGNAAISYDVPPFSVAADRNDIVGLNLVGLRRRGFGADQIADLKRCFRAVYHQGGNVREEAQEALAAAAGLEGCGKTGPGRQFLEFFAQSRRGFGHKRRPRRGGEAAAAAE